MWPNPQETFFCRGNQLIDLHSKLIDWFLCDFDIDPKWINPLTPGVH